MLIKFAGLADVRIIRKGDAAAISEDMGGPIEHDTVVWDASNPIREVSDDLGQFLLTHDPEFKSPTETEAAEFNERQSSARARQSSQEDTGKKAK